MSEPVERGPDYSWKTEALHYQTKYEDLLSRFTRLDHQAERLHWALEQVATYKPRPEHDEWDAGYNYAVEELSVLAKMNLKLNAPTTEKPE